MSRVHDALRRAENGGSPIDRLPVQPEAPLEFLPVSMGAAPTVRLNIHPGMLQDVEVVQFDPAAVAAQHPGELRASSTLTTWRPVL